MDEDGLSDDHAIVIGIRRYPTLGDAPLRAMDLEAPDRDAQSIASWLESPDGGRLRRKNIHMIRSADYPDPFDDDPKPVETDVVKAFETVFGKRDPSKGGRVGRRFYLYVSGHGFGHVRGRGALFTANATAVNRSHVFIASYFDWIYNAALFEQHVLWFDACSTRERLEMPQPVSLRSMIAPNAHQGRMMIAYAARFFLKAVETTVEGEPRGIFTHTLVRGLSGAAADPSTGAVTTASLRNYLINNMRRHMSLAQLADPDVSNEPDFGTVDDFELVPPSGSPTAGIGDEGDPAGPSLRLAIACTDPATEIFVVDAHDRLVARRLSGAEVSLPPADYTIRAKLGRAEWQGTVTLRADTTVRIPSIGFASAVPLDGTARAHETHAVALSGAAGAAEPGPGVGASLMVLARWWTASEPRQDLELPAPQAGLELHHHGGSHAFDLAEGADEGDRESDRWARRDVGVDPGLHRLALKTGSEPAALTVTALEGWQTRVALLYEPASTVGSIPRGQRLADVSIQMWPMDAPINDEAMRLAEAARMALADEQAIMSRELLEKTEAKFRNPMMGLYALHLMLLLERKEAQDQARRRPVPSPGLTPDRPVRFERALFDETLADTMAMFGEDHPDVRAIRLAAGHQAGRMPVGMPPMLWRSWASLVEASNANPRLVPVDLWERVADQTLHRPLMIWVRRSAAAVAGRGKSRKVAGMLVQASSASVLDRVAAPTSSQADRPGPAAAVDAAAPAMPVIDAVQPEGLGTGRVAAFPTDGPDAADPPDVRLGADGHRRTVGSPPPSRMPAVLLSDDERRRLTLEMGVPRSVVEWALKKL
ncbi:hypothetical protein [Jiella sp. R10]|uniref:Uncharacterized protein n=2 Tax=Antarcticirhabdus aurantiaca TaxID=2606717 RepID=A0ACD4NNZ0_9HYPH|nr:hypothetical protein OXU80_27235 [Jeongeuplla avenae]